MPFTDWNTGAPATHAPQEYGFVMSTTVDDLSYTPSEEEKSRDAAQFVATGRKSWKTLKGKGEAVWPPLLEAALLEALEKYLPDNGNGKSEKIMGRFPMRNRFISDYIFETTGKRRTPKQVGSRLQQLRDTCKKEQILQLISHRHTPEHSSADSQTDSSYGASPSPQPESHSQSSTSTSYVYVKIGLQSELWPSPLPSVLLISSEAVRPQIIQLSPTPQRQIGMSHSKASMPNILPFLSGSVEFRSPWALELDSMFMVYASDSNTAMHMEHVQLVCVSSPTHRSGWVYRSELVSNFWQTLCSSQDLSQYAIVQTIKPTNAGSISNGVDRSSTPSQAISIVYKFDCRTNASRRSSLANSLIYQSSSLPAQVQPTSSAIAHSGLPTIVPPSTWQIPDTTDGLNNECLQSLLGMTRPVDPNMHHCGPSATATSMAASYGQYQRSCLVPESNLKQNQANWDRSTIHAPVPLQYPQHLGLYYSA